MRPTLGAQVKIHLIRALVKSLGTRNFSLVNAQVFQLRFGVLLRDRGDEVNEYRIRAGIHFGHPSRITIDEPLVAVHMTEDMWQSVLANVDEINGVLMERRT